MEGFLCRFPFPAVFPDSFSATPLVEYPPHKRFEGGQAVKIGSMEIERQYVIRGARTLLYGAGGFLSAFCAIDGRAPLAAPLIAVLYPGREFAAALCGAVAGAVTFLSFAAALRCCGVLVLITAVFTSFRDTPWVKKPLFRPLCAAGATFAVELAYLVKLGLSWSGVSRLALSTLLAALLCHYGMMALGRWAVPRRQERSETRNLRERLRMGVDALRAVYESISLPAPKTEENPAVIFDRAAEVVCRGCALCEVCWSREYISTFNAFNDATPAILERGRAEKTDFALHFASRCIHFPQLISAINTEVTALLLRRAYRRRLDEERSRTRGQYAQLSELVVQALSAPETEQTPGREVPHSIAMASTPKNGQRVCGDSVTWFRGNGRVHLLLSDGMGSGLEAQRESKLALRLVEQFLCAGIEAENALRTLNAALNLRADEHGGFTTIDLLSLEGDPCQAQLCKYGAAPTYIKHHGTVRRVTGSALPAGLQEVGSAVTPIRFPLEEQTFVLMVSDGIADSSDDKWLLDLLAGWQGDDPNALVSLVMDECRKRRGGDDDCSAVCLYLPERNRGKREV